MSRIKNFRELRVWKSAFDIAMKVYEISKSFPREERYSLTDQSRRSSRSVAANIAETWSKRRYDAAFCAKLSDAEAEATETQVWLLFAYRCGYLSRSQATALGKRYEEILAQLIKMMNHPDQWRV